MDVSQYLDIFIDETNEHIQSLSDNIMILEKEPENKDTINEIFRAAHSLKGMAGTMGFKRMQHLTHDMENVFSEVRNDTVKVNAEMIDVLFQCLDAIEAYLDNVKATSDEGTEDNAALIDKLNAFLPGANGGAAAAAAPAPAAEAPKAEEAPAETDGKAYLNITLEDSQKEQIQSAIDGGQNVYAFTVSVQKECLLKAARAFLVFKAVEDFGEILIYSPSSQDIEDEKFDTDFSIIVASKEPFDKIKDAITQVSEIDHAIGEQVTVDTYNKVEKEKEAAEESAKAAREEREAAASALVDVANEAVGEIASPGED